MKTLIFLLFLMHDRFHYPTKVLFIFRSANANIF